MKALVLALVTAVIAGAAPARAEDVFGLPLPPQARAVEKTETTAVFKVRATHDQVLEYYREVLKDQKDVRIREWAESTYVEDDGNAPWHSITISRADAEGTTVTIKKDNWSWILATVLLRFAGVFFVLSLLWLGISLSGAVISRLVAPEARSASGQR
jgi:hypothetical protein